MQGFFVCIQSGNVNKKGNVDKKFLQFVATGGTPTGHSEGYERGKSNNFVQFATLPCITAVYNRGRRGHELQERKFINPL